MMTRSGSDCARARLRAWMAQPGIADLPELERLYRAERDLGLHAVPCPTCDGASASLAGAPCARCDSDGVVFTLSQEEAQ